MIFGDKWESKPLSYQMEHQPALFIVRKACRGYINKFNRGRMLKIRKESRSTGRDEAGYQSTVFAGRRKVYGKDGALLFPSPNTKKAAPELLLLLQGHSWLLCDSNTHWAQALQRQAMARSASGPKGSLLGGALLWQPVGCTAQQRPQRGRLRRKLHKGE